MIYKNIISCHIKIQLPYNNLYKTEKSPGGKLLAYFRQNQMLVLIFDDDEKIDLQKLKIFLDKNLVLKGMIPPIQIPTFQAMLHGLNLKKIFRAMDQSQKMIRRMKSISFYAMI